MRQVKTQYTRHSRRSKSGRYFRTFLMFACLALTIFIVKAMVAKAVRPYWINHNEKKESADIQKQIAQAKAENLAFKQEIIHLGTPEGKEEEARKLGWVKQGEVAVVVPDSGPSPFASEPLPQETFWDHLGRRMAGVFVKGR